MQPPTGATSNSSQSGEICGKLKQMKGTFETYPETSKTEDATSAKAYVELKRAKPEELAAAIQKQENREIEFGDTKENKARHKEDPENTEDTNEIDTEPPRISLRDARNPAGTGRSAQRHAPGRSMRFPRRSQPSTTTTPMTRRARPLR